ncbi:hypothetical protein BCR33DRAFT_714619, partial [Rhizoclosmatium globosum]
MFGSTKGAASVSQLQSQCAAFSLGCSSRTSTPLASFIKQQQPTAFTDSNTSFTGSSSRFGTSFGSSSSNGTSQFSEPLHEAISRISGNVIVQQGPPSLEAFLAMTGVNRSIMGDCLWMTSADD